jgi:hypothetical protein
MTIIILFYFPREGGILRISLIIKKKTRVPYRTKGKEKTKEGKGKEEREKNKKQHKRENALYVTRSFCLPA